MTPAIEVAGLRKSFGSNSVLAGVDLTVAPTEVFALLGPNGAGKTTIVQILSTLLQPDSGVARVAGCDLRTDPDGVRRAIGVTGQFSAVDNLLTGEENLWLMADLNHLGRTRGRATAVELLERFDLTGAARQLVMTYSGGMRRRLDLAMTLVGAPQVIFLDEPTTGLDPRSRRTMWEIVRELAQDGITILLTTQYLDEADRLAHRVALLDSGRLVAEGSPQELKQRITGGRARLFFADSRQLAAAAVLLPDATADDDPFALQVETDNSPSSLMALLARIREHGLGVERVDVQGPDLDDVFFALTGHDRQKEDSAA